jgi:hypothetical protein
MTDMPLGRTYRYYSAHTATTAHMPLGRTRRYYGAHAAWADTTLLWLACRVGGHAAMADLGGHAGDHVAHK